MNIIHYGTTENPQTLIGGILQIENDLGLEIIIQVDQEVRNPAFFIKNGEIYDSYVAHNFTIHFENNEFIEKAEFLEGLKSYLLLTGQLDFDDIKKTC